MNKIIVALTQAVLTQAMRRDFPDDDPGLVQTARILCRKIAAMPVLLRGPMTVLVLMFDAYGIAIAGRPFNRQSLIQRRRQVEQWAQSPVSISRQFVQFFTKMGVFIYCSVCPNNFNHQE